MVLVVQGESDAELLTASDAVGGELADVPGVARVSPVGINDDGDTAVLTLVPTTSPQDAATEDLVDTLRAMTS